MDLIGATYVRDVEPGEVLVISADGLRSIKPFPPAPLAHCVFEHVYFARPDSYVFGKSVNEVRTNLGRILAREQPVDADVVVPVPDSGVCAAMGFAEEAGIPLRMGLIRNHYVGRTFIQPQSSIRHFGVKVKLNPVRSILEGKRVVLVDDSIVRGTTSRKIVRMVRAAGAREVHVRISCPPTISPCFYGVDTPQPVRADRRDAHARRDPRLPRRRQRRLPEPRRADDGRRRRDGLATAARATRATTRCEFPRDEKTLPAARAEARQGAGHELMTDARGSRAIDAGPDRSLLRRSASSCLASACAQRPSQSAQEPAAPAGRLGRSSCRPRSTSSAISTTPRARRVAHRPAHRRRRRPCRRCCRRWPSTPTATCGIARSSC